jgi:hypothetical protein
LVRPASAVLGVKFGLAVTCACALPASGVLPAAVAPATILAKALAINAMEPGGTMRLNSAAVALAASETLPENVPPVALRRTADSAEISAVAENVARALACAADLAVSEVTPATFARAVAAASTRASSAAAALDNACAREVARTLPCRLVLPAIALRANWRQSRAPEFPLPRRGWPLPWN